MIRSKINFEWTQRSTNIGIMWSKESKKKKGKRSKQNKNMENFQMKEKWKIYLGMSIALPNMVREIEIF